MTTTLRRIWIGAAACGALAAMTTSAAPQSPPAPAGSAPSLASAYGRLPAIMDVAISPDGTKIALAEDNGQSQVVEVLDLAERRQILAIALRPDQALRGVNWADDRFALGVFTVTVKTTDVERAGWTIQGPRRLLEYSRTLSIDTQTKQSVLLMDKSQNSWALGDLARMDAPIEGDPGSARVMAPVTPASDSPMALMRIDLATGRGSTLRVFASGATDEVQLDRRGAPVARSTIVDLKKNTWDIRAVDTKGERVIETGESLVGLAPGFVGLFPDGRLGVIRNEGQKKAAHLTALNLATGKSESVFSAPGFDVDSTILDPTTREIVGVQWIDAIAMKQKFFDPTLAKAAETLEAAFPGQFTRIVSWSKDRSKLIVSALTAKAPSGAYLLYEPATQKVRTIGVAYPEVKTWAQVDSITYAARDDVRIPAILTSPDVPAGAKSPLVVLVHGGPASRDSGEFDWWPQFLAARGYMVLQPNFRGSSGFGLDWKQDGYGEWGGVMSRDVEDGVRALIRSGRVDPNRICFVGASYGAYAALTAAMQSPDLTRCAAGIGGVYDLQRFLADRIRTTASGSSIADWWTTSIGDLKDDKDKIVAVSPALNAAKIKAPVLLMHGTEDSVVSISQTKTMRDGLAAAGNPAAYVELTGDDHWLSSATMRTRMLEQLDSFLAAHLGVAPTASSAGK